MYSGMEKNFIEIINKKVNLSPTPELEALYRRYEKYQSSYQNRCNIEHIFNNEQNFSGAGFVKVLKGYGCFENYCNEVAEVLKLPKYILDRALSSPKINTIIQELEKIEEKRVYKFQMEQIFSEIYNNFNGSEIVLKFSEFINNTHSEYNPLTLIREYMNKKVLIPKFEIYEKMLLLCRELDISDCTVEDLIDILFNGKQMNLSLLLDKKELIIKFGEILNLPKYIIDRANGKSKIPYININVAKEIYNTVNNVIKSPKFTEIFNNLEKNENFAKAFLDVAKLTIEKCNEKKYTLSVSSISIQLDGDVIEAILSHSKPPLTDVQVKKLKQIMEKEEIITIRQQ